MNKQEFLVQLRKGLSGLPPEDIDERLMFYSEMIDDRMEDGIPEETAVDEIGDVDELVSQIIADTPLTKLVKGKITPKKKRKAWEIVLLVLGSPIWASLLIAAVAVVFAVYAAVWSVLIALWAVFVALAAGGLAGAVSGGLLIFQTHILVGIAMIGAGCVCAGLSVFLFFGCKAATRGMILLTEKSVLHMKNCLIKKEEVQ